MAVHAIAALLGGEAIFRRVIGSDLALARDVERGFPSASLDCVRQELEHSSLDRAAVLRMTVTAHGGRRRITRPGARGVRRKFARVERAAFS